MIVKILSSSASFKGVNYNTNKVDNNKGELLKVSGFGPLQGMDRIRPEDYVNYLKMVSAQNKGIKSPQFHVAISTKGRAHSKIELMEIAEHWLTTMGYSNQPYLIIFHKDTRNNHIHIVSSRIDKEGHKISSAFEKNRAIQNLNKIMGLNEGLQAKKHFEDALSFNFSSKAQFMMILESANYTIRETNQKIELIKYGKVAAEFNRNELDNKIAEYKKQIKNQKIEPLNAANNLRATQLKAIFNKYITMYPTELVLKTEPLPGGREKALSAYTSVFSEFMKEKFGVEIIYHAENGLQPYGYSIIDHSGKRVFKGGEVMHIKELLENGLANHEFVNEDIQVSQKIGTEPTTWHTGERGDFRKKNDDDPLGQSYTQNDAAASEVTGSKTDHSHAVENSNAALTEDFTSYSAQISIDISDDIDDEAILGRNRRRQKKARTNTR